MKPSIWGKLKANVQFLAILLAIVRTSEPWGPLYPDQYAMLAAAAVTVGSAVEYFARFGGLLIGDESDSRACSGPAFLTGGSGFVGGALLRATGRGRTRGARRSPAPRDAAAVVEAAGGRPVRGDLFDDDALVLGMRGCETVFHVAGVNAMCCRDPEPMFRTNVDGSASVVPAAARAGVARVVYTSSAATIGEPRGVVGAEDTPHRGTFLSAYERSKFLAERRVFALGAELGVDVVCRQPVVRPGPGPDRGLGPLAHRPGERALRP